MSFLHPPREDSGAGGLKFAVLAVIVLAALGGVTYWFLTNAPEPPIETGSEPEPVVERETPEPAAEAPPPRESAPAFGSLAVRASVTGASVYVDGELVGEAPYTNDELSPGDHAIRVEKEGYEPFEDSVRVRAGRRAELSARLDLLRPSLRIMSDVAGATVFLDRNYVGTTPVDIKDVAPGEHQLTVSAEGYDMYAESLSVTTGHRDVRVSFKNVALSESLPVVHKHRFGSCEGVLVADNNGLRYETSNESDAFTAAFSELEQFEVDYIEKNLNVKVRRGRNYNFTEKSGNADALFVFHKNVQAFVETM